MQQLSLVLAPFGLAAALLVPGPTAAADDWQTEQTDPAEYGTAADEISQGEAEALLLELINAERAAESAAPLGLDPLAAELAWTRAMENVADGRASHYDPAGRKCEQRFNLLGRTDHVTENLLVYEISYRVHLTPQLVRRMHLHWMAEPGHRANILDPAHTALGAGFVLESKDAATIAAGAIIFVNDHGDSDRLPVRVAAGSRHWLTGCLAPAAAQLAGVSLALEPLADVSPPADPLRYRMPEPSIVYLPEGGQFTTDGAKPYLIRELDYNPESGYFSVQLYIPAHWSAGRVYVTVWAQASAGARFPAMTQVLELQDVPATES